MASGLSASQWGHPSSNKRALLVHGFTSSSQTWHRVGKLLSAEGYLVTAVDLLGHGTAERRSTDYTFATLSEELRPFFSSGVDYDLLIGHSLGGVVVLHLLRFLTPSKTIPVILLDPPLERTVEENEERKATFLDDILNVKTIEALMEEHPLWTREDALWKIAGARLCDPSCVFGIFQANQPWSFSHYLATLPSHIKMTILSADPLLKPSFKIERMKDLSKVNVLVVKGAAHWIQYEFPEVVVEAALNGVVNIPLVKL